MLQYLEDIYTNSNVSLLFILYVLQQQFLCNTYILLELYQ